MRAGPVIITGAPAPGHAIVRSPPRVVDAHALVEQAAADAGHHRRARAGAARERLAGAALPHAQPNVSAIDDLHVARVHALRKRGWRSISGPCVVDRRVLDVGDDLHRVRIAHRHAR